MKFYGSYVPLVTPFNPKGRLDQAALEKLVEWHIQEGTDAMIPCATTGEGVTLSNSERKQVAEICIRVAQKRVPILVATGTNDTRASVQNTERAQAYGADGCLVVTPYYNKPSQEGCIAHFQEIAKVGLPMILYHNPPRTAVRLTSETIIHLSQNPSIVAIKESSHDLDLIARIVQHIPVFSGDDDLCWEILKLGGVGSIATTANLIPRSWKEMVDLCLQERWDEGAFLHSQFLPLIRSIFLETNPQGVKYALSLLGKCGKTLRLPMMEPTPPTKEAIAAALHSLKPILDSRSVYSSS